MLKERKDYVEGLVKLNGEKLNAQVRCASVNVTADGVFIDCEVNKDVKYLKDGVEKIGRTISSSLYDFIYAARLIDGISGIRKVLSRDYNKIQTLLFDATISGYLVKVTAGDHTSVYDDEKVYTTNKDRYIFYYTDIKLGKIGQQLMMTILYPDIAAQAMAATFGSMFGVTSTPASTPAAKVADEPETDDGSDA